MAALGHRTWSKVVGWVKLCVQLCNQSKNTEHPLCVKHKMLKARKQPSFSRRSQSSGDCAF